MKEMKEWEEENDNEVALLKPIKKNQEKKKYSKGKRRNTEMIAPSKLFYQANVIFLALGLFFKPINKRKLSLADSIQQFNNYKAILDLTDINLVDLLKYKIIRKCTF